MANDVEISTKLTLAGDTEYKAALKNINNELKVAKSGMNAATAAFARNDRSMAANKTRIEELNKVQDARKSKLDLLASEIEKLTKAEGANSDDVQKLKVTYNNLQAEIKRTDREIEELGNSTEEDVKQTKEATKESKHFGEALKKIGGKTIRASVSALAAGFAAVGAAAVKAGKELAGFVSGSGEYVDDINTLSVQTGVSAETLQKWSYAEKLIDVDMSTMTGSMKKMVVQMGKAAGGSKDAAAKFKKLGVSITDSNGNMRDSEEVFYEAIDALGKISNETERDALAMEIFGKSADELNPLISAGTDRLRQLGDEAESTGYVLSDKLMWGAQRYQDAHDKMNNASMALKNTVGALLGPTMAGFADQATSMMTKVTKALSDGLQPGELDALMDELIGDFKMMFGNILSAGRKVLPKFTQLLSALVSTLVENLPGYIETLLPAVTGFLQSILDSLTAEAGPLATLASSIIVSLAEFITTNLPKVAQSALDIFNKLIDGLTEALPKLLPMAIKMIVKLAVSLVQAIPLLVKKIPKITAAIVEGLKDIDWIELGTELITGLATGLSDAAVAGWEAIQAVFDAIWKGIKGIFGIGSSGDGETEETSKKAKEAAQQIIDSLVSGFKSAVEAAASTISHIFSSIWTGIKAVFGIKSGEGEDESSTLAKDAAGGILNGLVNGFTGAVDAVITSVKEIFGRIWDAIKSIFGFGKSKEQKKNESDAKTAGGDIMTGMKSGIEDNEKKVKTAASDAGQHTIDSLNNVLGNKYGTSSTKGKSIGKNLATGFAEGITNNESKITKAAKDAAKAAYDAAKNELDIHSPSKVMMKIGAFYDQGFAEGIERNADRVVDAAGALSEMTVRPNSGYNATSAGMAAAAAVNNAQSSGGGVTINTTYSGPFTANDAGVFGQTLARSIRGAVAVMG